jgi:hypothetical protein
MKRRFGLIAGAAGLIMAAMSLGLGVPRAFALHDKDKDDDDDHGGAARAQFVYAAKVLCPASGVTTAINVHNPGTKAVTIAKKGIALDSGQVPTPPGDRKQDTLNPDWALQMGCSDLMSLGAVGPGGFGDVIIESGSELDVWAVYLTTGTTGGSEPTTTIIGTEVVRVPATRVKK